MSSSPTLKAIKLSLFIVALNFCLGPFSAKALDANAAVKVTPLMKTSQSWDGQPLKYPSGQAEVSAMMIEIAPGGQTGWHLHPVPSFALILEGTLDVSLKDGKIKQLKAGDTLAEVVDTLHNGKNKGKIPVKLIVFYTGSVGSQLTVKE